jgi:DNA-binding IclR family transcriptional regulator
MDVILALGKAQAPLPFTDLQEATRIAATTLGRVLSDCQHLGLIKQQGERRAFEYRLSAYAQTLMKKAKLLGRMPCSAGGNGPRKRRVRVGRKSVLKNGGE